MKKKGKSYVLKDDDYSYKVSSESSEFSLK